MSKIGIALAGGGPLGGIYEVGACAALAEAIDGLDFSHVDFYVGVSSGALIASILANNIPPARLARILINDDAAVMFDPGTLLHPALTEYLTRLGMLPNLLASSLQHYLAAPCRHGLFESLQQLNQAIPTGLFDGQGIDRILTELFSKDGFSNSFHALHHRLSIIATDLDSGQAIAFGSPGFDDITVSKAVQASTALPGLFPPVKIKDRYYVDGALVKTLHASVALEQGADLVFCVNPLVPYRAPKEQANTHKLYERGLPGVLSQTFRAIIHSRLHTGMSRYKHEYPHADVLLFEPARDNEAIFFANVFSYRDRRSLCEHAYQHTRTDLYRRRQTLAPLLEKHGLKLNMAVITDKNRSLLLPKKKGLGGTLQNLERTLDKLKYKLDDKISI
ncbi:patatin-like phospholipase family protein [Craterilacuibacter sinensis]|uniref:Patatin family protein n=1 Tax=Craterilacuibacter sinensis TaxID=2686017 RepID=A0A845BJB2_9NEIS|nr:patatin-like phospholipase family protein [Craterilacuibacter sinensis]MXR36269.1 patatin family protein [Craterilacuibacter sinensis]